jgi:polysaccharide chain length determinant protein (PEP-CTERM system associated)
MVVPKSYEAKTLILVQEQKVPQDFVRSIVTTNIEDRLMSISQEVTSRTNLESIIKEYKMFADTDMVMEQKVEELRKAIKLDVAHAGGAGKRGKLGEANAFTIAYRDHDARRAMDVANGLASKFISENLKMRESQALGTSDFLADELDNVKRRLAEKEEELKVYRERYMGAMPEHLDTNLKVLGGLQTELERVNNNLRDAENRKLLLQQHISQTRALQEQTAGLPVETSGLQGRGASSGIRDGKGRTLADLKAELTALEARYTSSHPDVIRLREMIAKLEAEEGSAQAQGGQVGQAPASPVRPSPPPPDSLAVQLEQVNLQIRNLNLEIKRIEEKAVIYQQRIEQTPKRQQELLSLSRDYENLKKLYDSLLDRKLEAEIAVSMEKKQKGEQFRIIDPAKMPELPVEPDMRKIILITLALALGSGCGLAYAVEMMDTSFKTPESAEKELDIPVLVSMPLRFTEGELRTMKRKRILAYATVTAAFVLSAVAIVLATKGVHDTVRFVKETLGLV